MSKDFTITQRLTKVAYAHSQDIAVITKKDNDYIRHTYGDLYNHTRKIAAFLIKEGINKGARVAIVSENSFEWIYIYFGIISAGATCVPLDPQLTKDEIDTILKDSGSRLLFVSKDISLPQKNQIKTIIIESPQFLNALEIPLASDLILPKNSPNDIASILYTSGTTAKPKGVCLTHRNFLFDFESILSLNLIMPRDNFIAILPFYHAYAFTVTVLSPLFSGATITLPESLNSEELRKVMRDTKVTVFVTVPQILGLIHKAIFDRIAKFPLIARGAILGLIFVSSIIKKSINVNLAKFLFWNIHTNFGGYLRFIVSGGARLDPKVERDLLNIGFTVIEGYGLTETSPIVSLNPPTRLKIGSVGKAIPNVDIKIVDATDPNKILQPGEIGEVVIKGDNVMSGYFNRLDLTHEVLRHGWFYSGDLGYLDKEGYLYLTGRKKEVIVLSSGKNIFPEELEDYYLRSPYIKEICILEKRQKTLGRKVDALEAVIVPDLEYFKQTGEINVQTKIRWVLENLSQNLASFKRIMGFTLVTEPLSRTHLGKIKRYEVKQRYIKGVAKKEKPPYSTEDLYFLEREPAKSIMKYLNKELNKKVYLDDHVELDLGLDSISRVELVLGLEKILGISIEEELMGNIFTVRELILELTKIMKDQQKLPPAQEAILSWTETIKEIKDEAILNKIRLAPDIYDRLLNFIFKHLFNFVLRIFWGLKIQGRNNLPKSKPYLICPNHASFLDAFFIYASMPYRDVMQLYFLGDNVFFRHWISSWIIRPFRVVPLNTATNLTLSMQTASYLLRNKKSMCIFPEGMRSIDEKVNDFKKGVGILAWELNLPLIPVYIKGSHYSWPRGKNLPRFHPIRVIFGQPKSPEELLRLGKEKGIADNYGAIVSALREEVLKLGDGS